MEPVETKKAERSYCHRPW